MRNDDPDAVRRARLARRQMNSSEKKLWRCIQAGALGHHFRRQYPVKNPDADRCYYLDFYCPKAKLA